mmetsp:Transcript_5200/g.8037  ORF Transcript_5200/g.8037 Transcript_5200/m.8037 type:complete len:80 (+) Transcript_5200:361-600(+)
MKHQTSIMPGGVATQLAHSQLNTSGFHSLENKSTKDPPTHQQNEGMITGSKYYMSQTEAFTKSNYVIPLSKIKVAEEQH